MLNLTSYTIVADCVCSRCNHTIKVTASYDGEEETTEQVKFTCGKCKYVQMYQIKVQVTTTLLGTGSPAESWEEKAKHVVKLLRTMGYSKLDSTIAVAKVGVSNGKSSANRITKEKLLRLAVLEHDQRITSH